MELSDLPVDVLGLIFQILDLEFLLLLLLLFPANSSHALLRIIETVRYSRVLVTNSWRQLLKLLPRAKKIDSVEMLARYTYMLINEFRSFIPTWESKLHPEVTIRSRIVFVICCDRSNAEDRYKVIREFARLLKTMPASVLNISRLVFLSMTDLPFLVEKNVDEELIALLFDRVGKTTSLHVPLHSLSLVGPVAEREQGSLSWPLVYDYRSFSGLNTVCLSNLGLVSLMGVFLPSSIRHLVLSHNSILSLRGFEFPPDLVTLDLSYNYLVGSFKADLPQNLKVLNVRRNDIANLMSLPDSIEDLDISFNDLPSTLVKIPGALKVLRTDIAQFYLMTEKIQLALRVQQVCVKKNIASRTHESIFAHR